MVCVPRAAMMTVDTATESPHSGGLVDRAGLGQWQAMCLHLLTERAAGDGSRWAPYLRCEGAARVAMHGPYLSCVPGPNVPSSALIGSLGNHHVLPPPRPP